MKDVLMPAVQRRFTIPDEQCGFPVLNGRDGDMEYYPCNKPAGHRGPDDDMHSMDEPCPYTVESFFNRTFYICTLPAFHSEKEHYLMIKDKR